MATITKEALQAATKDRVKAVFGAKDSTGAPFGTNGTGTGKFVLPNEDLDIITEMLNHDNPLSVYTGVTISAKGSGSVEVKYDIYNDNWVEKTKLGSTPNDIENAIIDDEVFKWNKPFQKEEGVSKFDIDRGFPNTLSSRLATASTKFLQGSIKDAFAKLVTHTATPVATLATGQESSEVVVIDFTTEDKLQESYIKFLQAISAFTVANEIDESEIVVTLAPSTFDALSTKGLIGDRSAQTFAGGQFSVGTMGGYRVQSGGMYIPSGVTGDTAGAKVEAFVGINKLALYGVGVVAANLYEVGGSNDIATYLEESDIFGALDYKKHFSKVGGLVIVDKALTFA